METQIQNAIAQLFTMEQKRRSERSKNLSREAAAAFDDFLNRAGLTYTYRISDVVFGLLGIDPDNKALQDRLYCVWLDSVADPKATVTKLIADCRKLAETVKG